MKSNSIWLIVGEDDFLCREALANIERDVGQEADRAVFWAKDQNLRLQDVFDLARTKALIGKMRLIIVHGVDRLSSEERDLFLAYARAPYRGTTFVLTTRKMPEDDFSNELRRYVRLIDASGIYDGELSLWIGRRIELRRKKVTKEALSLLIENIGNDPAALDDAIERISLYVGERDQIQRRDVEVQTGRSRTESAFALADAVAEHALSRALRICASLTNEGKEPTEVLGLLGWHFRRLIYAKRLMRQGAGPAAIGRALHIGQYFLERFLRQVRNLDEEMLVSKLKNTLERDVNIKMGYEQPESILSFLLVELSR